MNNKIPAPTILRHLTVNILRIITVGIALMTIGGMAQANPPRTAAYYIEKIATDANRDADVDWYIFVRDFLTTDQMAITDILLSADRGERPQINFKDMITPLSWSHWLARTIEPNDSPETIAKKQIAKATVLSIYDNLEKFGSQKLVTLVAQHREALAHLEVMDAQLTREGSAKFRKAFQDSFDALDVLSAKQSTPAAICAATVSTNQKPKP